MEGSPGEQELDSGNQFCGSFTPDWLLQLEREGHVVLSVVAVKHFPDKCIARVEFEGSYPTLYCSTPVCCNNTESHTAWRLWCEDTTEVGSAAEATGDTGKSRGRLLMLSSGAFVGGQNCCPLQFGYTDSLMHMEQYAKDALLRGCGFYKTTNVAAGGCPQWDPDKCQPLLLYSVQHSGMMTKFEVKPATNSTPQLSFLKTVEEQEEQYTVALGGFLRECEHFHRLIKQCIDTGALLEIVHGHSEKQLFDYTVQETSRQLLLASKQHQMKTPKEKVDFVAGNCVLIVSPYHSHSGCQYDKVMREAIYGEVSRMSKEAKIRVRRKKDILQLIHFHCCDYAACDIERHPGYLRHISYTQLYDCYKQFEERLSYTQLLAKQCGCTGMHVMLHAAQLHPLAPAMGMLQQLFDMATPDKCQLPTSFGICCDPCDILQTRHPGVGTFALATENTCYASSVGVHLDPKTDQFYDMLFDLKLGGCMHLNEFIQTRRIRLFATEDDFLEQDADGYHRLLEQSDNYDRRTGWRDAYVFVYPKLKAESYRPKIQGKKKYFKASNLQDVAHSFEMVGQAGEMEADRCLILQPNLQNTRCKLNSSVYYPILTRMTSVNVLYVITNNNVLQPSNEPNWIQLSLS